MLHMSNLATRGLRWPQWRGVAFIPQSSWGINLVEYVIISVLSAHKWGWFYSISSVWQRWMNVHILYLGSDQGVKPLDRFIVRYEAVHPIHIQHYLTESWKERNKERDGVWLIICHFSFVFFFTKNWPSHLSCSPPKRPRRTVNDCSKCLVSALNSEHESQWNHCYAKQVKLHLQRLTWLDLESYRSPKYAPLSLFLVNSKACV